MPKTTNKVHQTLRKQFSAAMTEHHMLEEDDHVLVGLSGGKDSWALLGLFVQLQKRCPFSFRLSAVTVDGGLEGFDPQEIEQACQKLGVPFHYERQAIFATVAEKKDPKSTFCSLCARLRRGSLYGVAKKLGATKLALGHHLNDAAETLLLNLFFGGRVAALPPVLYSDAGNVPILRPLLYCEESLLAAYAEEMGFPVVGCICPVCPTHPDHEYSDLKRVRMKKLLSQLSSEIPGLHRKIRGALQNLEPNRFLDARFSEKVAKELDVSFRFP